MSYGELGVEPSDQNERIRKIVESQQLIKSCDWFNWRISKNWGQVPHPDEVTKLGFCGYAITQNLEEAAKPDLDSRDATQIVFGPRSVLMWTASFEDELDSKISNTFQNFKWEKN